MLSIAGSNNLFAGSFAGAAPDNTGANNTFVGRSAGLSNTTGGGNSFFGAIAGQNNTTSFDNSFFGRDAGVSNTTGSHNTVIGQGADTGANNLDFATALGSGAIVSASNTVVLGRANDTVQIPGNFDGSNIKSGTIPESRLGIPGMAFMGRSTFNGAGTQFFAPNGISSQSSSFVDVEMLTPKRSCTAQNLSVKTSGALTFFNTWVFTLRVNDVDTAVNCTVSGSTTSCNSGAATFAVPAGSRIVIKSNRGENTTLNFQFGWECR